MRIDPTQITKFDRTQAELEWFLLFCISTAGKNATVTAKKINDRLVARTLLQKSLTITEQIGWLTLLR